MAPQSTPTNPPSSILILGGGAFGLSTALALTTHPSIPSTTRIHLIDRHASPHPSIASMDSSRLVRADYADAAYSRLANSASALWRGSEWGAEGRYSESGFCLVADKGREEYVMKSLENAERGEDGRQGRIVRLKGWEGIREVVRELGGATGEVGYLNRGSGWVDAERVMGWVRGRVEGSGRIEVSTGEVGELVYEGDGRKVVGARLVGGWEVRADVTVMAMGAWSGKFVDLRGVASATGQVLAYIDLSQEEQERYRKSPVLMNMSRGMFVVPCSQGHLKVARHAYGYVNPVRIRHPDPLRRGEEITVSLPRTKMDDPELWIPDEGRKACREALREMVPDLGERPFSQTRICWYSDTPKGDYLITYHPRIEGLFLATGDSGHGFKMFPVLGDKIVDCLLGNTPDGFKDKWCWPKKPVDDLVWTEDGSRGGIKGMSLDAELRKGSRL
ncbi:MAG: hypothetical protein M1820_003127 [Bogoriella megaspora]|nr:MAG: hypothetical protein M1820_003127 [Bogoriella megaspora]